MTLRSIHSIGDFWPRCAAHVHMRYVCMYLCITIFIFICLLYMLSNFQLISMYFVIDRVNNNEMVWCALKMHMSMIWWKLPIDFSEKMLLLLLLLWIDAGKMNDKIIYINHCVRLKIARTLTHTHSYLSTIFNVDYDKSKRKRQRRQSKQRVGGGGEKYLNE